MPLIVDKEEMQKKILEAFEKCIEDKPLVNISLRDIASKAGMSHPKLLNYFPSKNNLIISYCRYTKDYMTTHCQNWFLKNERKNYASNHAYLNAFMEYVANGKTNENRPNATVQTYIFAKYNPEIESLIVEEFETWRATMENCLISIYGTEVGKKEAEAMMILITGTFICNYNHVLTGNINQDMLDHFYRLSENN